MQMHRQFIKAIDIQIFFGKSQMTSNKMLRSIRKFLKKEKYQPITIMKFCTYFRVEEEGVIKTIVANDASKTT